MSFHVRTFSPEMCHKMSVTGLDKESDLVHMEAHTPNGRIQYVTCRALTCSEPNRNYPFPGYIDISSLVVQDDYMFIQVTTAGQASYYVSYQRDPFLKIKLPKYSLPKDLHIVSTDEHQVFAAVAGIKGMLIANRRLDNQVKTYITYNKGRDWRLLQAPATDLAGNDIHCVLPFCSLHLQLQTSENPYLSGSISTKASAPGIIVATGNIGSELSYNNVGMFISSDAGNNWRQIFEEEHNVWFLDKGGALVAVKQPTVPTRHLQFFGHFSHRSEWQLIKIDYKSIFNRKCTEGDYQTWHLHNKGEPCVMGQKQIYMKRRPGNYCMLGKDYAKVLSAESCICRAHDFEWSCSQGQNYLNSTGYRKVVSNNCIKGVKDMYTPRKQMCPNRAPKGLSLSTREGKLTADLGTNVTFLVHLDEGDSMRTNIQLDFGDGTAVSYSNLSWIEEGIRHVYKTAGIFRSESSKTESESSSVFVSGNVEHVQLLAPFVAIKNKEPVISLDGSISYTFTSEGMNTVTVQVSSANAILQDTKTIAVQEFFKSLLLSFSPNLDEFNPDVPEWRQDVGRVIKKALLQVSDFPEDQLLVAVFPGVPTAAELFLLPHKNQSEGRKKKEEELEQISEILASALNQNLVEFELKPGERVIVYITQLTLAPLVDSSPRHSSSAMLMLLSVVFLGLAVFLIYKFKRKIPWISIYAEVNQEKEQEMIGSVSQSDSTPKITLSEFSTPTEVMEKEMDARVK
ncbi:unnamed protein product, partial [Coregonus sp. 'balchen']